MLRQEIGRVWACTSLILVAGCGHTPHGLQYRLPPPDNLARGSGPLDRNPVVNAGRLEVATASPSGVDELVRLAVERNPRLARATFAVDAARGRYTQAGLYPNPDLAVNWDEVGDRTGPGGILTAPLITQTVVTGRKLSLSQAVAAAEVDQSSLALLAERYAMIAAVRGAYYDLLTLQRRIETQRELVRLAEEAVKQGRTLLENKQIARLDLIQLEAELERFRAEAEASEQELPAARRQLAAAVGDPHLAVGSLDGPFDTVPTYDPDRTLEVVLATNPQARSAQVGVARAQAAVRRAEAEPIPNLSLYAGYVRQDQNKSNDFSVGLGGRIPVFDRNQGNIHTARAELGMAISEVGRVENALTDQVATALRVYSAAVYRAERYRTEILPRAREAADLALKAFKEGQFTYLRVLEANRVVAQSQLELVKSLGDAWKAAAELSGLLLEENWPERTAPPPPPGPRAGPTILPIPSVDKFDR